MRRMALPWRPDDRRGDRLCPEPLPLLRALDYMWERSSKQFDTDVVEAVMTFGQLQQCMEIVGGVDMPERLAQ